MVLSQVVHDAIEQEIEARVNEKITKVLEVISRKYDITLARLLKDLSSIDTSQSTCCCGITRTGKRCQKIGKYDGFCKSHMSQKPDKRVTRSASSPQKPTLQHIHSIPPLFMKGCPACEASSSKCSGVLRI